jgi:hypothetical protein
MTINTNTMETPALKDPAISPAKKVLQTALGKSYAAYEDLMTLVESDAFGLTPNWNYYNDGKAWLCKVQFKKKTVFWLSVWDHYFKLGFYFTEKNSKGIFDLDIDEEIKKGFKEHKSVGKLLPLVLSITKKVQLKDALKIIEYKKSLK